MHRNMKRTVKIKPCKKVETVGINNKPNGWLLEIVSDRDGFTKRLNGQVYLSVAAPGQFKGYHLHAVADYFITCLRGKVKHIIYTGPKKRREIKMGEGDFKTVFLPAGLVQGFKNVGKDDAYVLVYRYPSWSPDLREQLDIAPADITKKETWMRIKEFIKNFKQ